MPAREASAGSTLRWLRPDTEEATSSNLVTPTNFSQVMPESLGVTCYCINYLDRLAANGSIERSTRQVYGYMMRHVSDYFGERQISDLRAQDLEDWCQWMMRERGLSPASARKAYNLLAMCLRRALAVRDIDWSPTVAVKPPKTPPMSANPLTEESRQRLLRCLDCLRPTPCVMATRLALLTGMRRGEVCGLQWRDLELERSCARVRRSIGVCKGGTYVKGTKTGEERRVPLVPDLQHLLVERMDDAREMCRIERLDWSGRHYVCGKPDGSYLSPTILTRWWQQHSTEWGLVGTQGRPPTFHDLRHTYATLAVRALDPKTAQSILGHSDINMTMRYADTEIDQVQAAAQSLAGSF